MNEAPIPYAVRMKEARAAARAIRKAAEAERRAAFEKIARARYDAPGRRLNKR
jgi:hypothetical protein